jgi:hypothetical protein
MEHAALTGKNPPELTMPVKPDVYASIDELDTVPDIASLADAGLPTFTRAFDRFAIFVTHCTGTPAAEAPATDRALPGEHDDASLARHRPDLSLLRHRS